MGDSESGDETPRPMAAEITSDWNAVCSSRAPTTSYIIWRAEGSGEGYQLEIGPFRLRKVGTPSGDECEKRRALVAHMMRELRLFAEVDSGGPLEGEGPDRLRDYVTSGSLGRRMQRALALCEESGDRIALHDVAAHAASNQNYGYSVLRAFLDLSLSEKAFYSIDSVAWPADARLRRLDMVEEEFLNHRFLSILLAHPAGTGDAWIVSDVSECKVGFEFDRQGVGLRAGFDRLRLEVIEMGRDLRLDHRLIAQKQYQLLTENERLKKMQASGFFRFATRVDPTDFIHFLWILATGNRSSAARKLGVKERTFHDRVDSWRRKGGVYATMYDLVIWRKKVGRAITVDLDPSLLSREAPDHEALLRDVLRALAEQTPENWERIRDELIEILGKEVSQESPQ